MKLTVTQMSCNIASYRTKDYHAVFVSVFTYFKQSLFPGFLTKIFPFVNHVWYPGDLLLMSFDDP